MMTEVAQRLDAQSIADRLAQRADDAVRHILPSGKRHGSQWHSGSIRIETRGGRAGQWVDDSGESGDLLDLFARKAGGSIADGMRAAMDWLGVRGTHEPKAMVPRHWPRPAAIEGQPLTAQSWLAAHGLSGATIRAFQLQSSQTNERIVVPYIRDGEVIHIRTVSAETGLFEDAPDTEPCLFGWHAIDPGQRTVVLVRDEFDAMALYQMGIAALAIGRDHLVRGRGPMDWLDTDYGRMERFSTVWLLLGKDDAKLARDIARRLGLERCRLALLDTPVVERLADGADAAEFHATLDAAQTMDPPELRQLVDFFDEVMAELFPTGDTPDLDPALKIPQTQDWMRFRPGELTVWTGRSGHGKTLMLSQVCLGFLEDGQRVMVFSGEMPGKDQLRRTLLQAAGNGQPSIAYARAIRDYLAGRIWLHSIVGTADSAGLLDSFAYAARRYGCSQFVVDSLMMVDDIGEDTRGALELQRRFMLRLKAFARQYGVHVHLVAHPRKSMNGDDREPGKDDVAGSSKITSIADNVLAVWANGKPVESRDPDEPDGRLTLRKQRNGPVQARSVPMWLDQPCGQFRTVQHARPVSYVDFDVRHANQEF